ncbi:MAG: MFS transporter [Anaerolineales bacterium]
MENNTDNTSRENKSWAAPFFTIRTGQAISLMGRQMVQFALIWWLTKITGSAVGLTTASLVGLLPMVVLGPFVGALVDRWNRRKILLIADAGIALVTLVLAYAFYMGWAQVWMVYVALFLRALEGGFHGPAMSTSTSLMVPDEHLIPGPGYKLIALQRAKHHLGAFGSPAAGSLIYRGSPGNRCWISPVCNYSPILYCDSPTR